MPMKDREFFELSIQGVPIVLILCYVLFPWEFRMISHTVLGKLIAISLIILYTTKHIAYGFVICLVLVWYYQLHMENISLGMEHVWREGFDKSEYLPKPAKKRGSAFFTPKLEDQHTTYEKAYPDQLKPVAKENEAVFRKKHCRKGKLYHKNMEIKSENAPHVFSEMKFSQNTCNPCDETCRFEVKKIDTEKQLTPIESRGNDEPSWWKMMIPDSGNPFVGTGKDQASMF